MPTTTRGYTYPDSTGHTRIWEHVETLADDVDADVAAVEAAVAARFKYVFKPSSESVTSSTTLQDDNDLFLALPVGYWAIDVSILAIGATAGDIKIAWTFSGTAIAGGARAVQGPALGITAIDNATMHASSYAFATAVAYGVDGSANESVIFEKLFLNITVPGTLQCQWAQNASSGTATQVIAGSSITAVMVG